MNTRTHSPRPKALVPPELKEQLKRLNSTAPEGVNVLATVDAAKALEQFRDGLEVASTPLTLNVAKKICTSLRKPVLRKSRKLRYSISYSEPTIRATSSVFIHLVRTAVKTMAQPEASVPRPTKQGSQKSLTSLVTLTLNTLVLLCEKASEAESWKHCVEYASVVSDLTHRSSKDLLQQNSSFSTIRQGLISGLKSSLSQGRVGEAASIFESVRAIPSLRQALTEMLTTTLQGESAKLPISGQEWICTTLGIEREAHQLSYANPADAPEIRQAASLLLLLWDNSAESSMMREAFERFRNLCEKHFHLYLKGQSGEIADYDRRVHEVTGAEAGRVRLVRPWVEFLDPPHSAVVVRALATAV